MNIKLEKLDEEIERNLPEAIRILRAFYFKKLEEGEDDETRDTYKTERQED